MIFIYNSKIQYIDNYKFFNLIFYYSSSADDKYVKVENTRCTNYDVPSIKSLTSAKNECSQDSSCKGLWDFMCNGGGYFICRIGGDYLDENIRRSCVYDKKGMMSSFY